VSPILLFAEVPSFYASIERGDDPVLADRPVLVGGDPRKRGQVLAASLDALAAGVHLEMTMLEALEVCPRAKAVRTDMKRYREVSRRLFAALRRELPRLEPFGLGAAYFDVSGASLEPERQGDVLRERVLAELSLPLRVGIASSRFLARIAAERVGRDGVVRVAPSEEARLRAELPVTRLDGVGRKTAATLAEGGAHTIGDVISLGRERLEALFGAHGIRIHDTACGADEAPVRAAIHAQSLSRESAVRGEALDIGVLSELLQNLARELEGELALQGLSAGRITLKIRYADQQRITRSTTLASPTASAGEIQRAAGDLLARTQAGSRPLRGVGIQLARLAPAQESDRQLSLFPQRF
jgi:nucleotidyltransferase/DNA polymerase involved in DNA repair